MQKSQILIAGAGIGGLTAALCLARAGFRVRLIERAEVLEEVGAGLQISPNASTVLRDLGLLPALAADALAPRAIHIRRARDGATLARLPVEDAEARWGAPYLLVHRADLQRALVAAVVREPDIKLETGISLAGFAEHENGVEIAALHGDVRVSYDADGLIGADGLRSFVRARLSGAFLPDRAERVAFRALVEAERVAGALSAPESALWLGRKAHLVHYPLRGGKVINVVAVVDEPMTIDWRNFWSEPIEPRAVAARFAAFDPMIGDLIRGAKDWRRWPLVERPPLPQWCKGCIALLGDAAHPMLPFLAQGAAQAIEDAAALAQALSAHEAIPRAFAAYEATRRARATRVQADSRRQATIYHLSGPAALARDLAMRAMGPQRLLKRYDWLYRTR